MPTHIPLICDRCRAEGQAGDDPFEAFGALLDFDPVPRLKHRPDGWDAECQRAFIAALSLTGSVRAAARAVGKAVFGAEQLRRAEGAESFLAAWDEAMAMAADERSRRLAEAVRAAAADQSGWRPPEPPWANASGRRGRPSSESPPASPEDEAKAELELTRAIVTRYLLKLRQERLARLAGRVVAADFYVRQLTFLEVAVDLASEDAFRLFADLRRGDFQIFDIAMTDLSIMFDEARRLHWLDCGDPPRPAPPPDELLVRHDGVVTEPGECALPGQELDAAAQFKLFDDRHARAAKEQIEWEAQARRDYERRRATPPLIDEEPRQAGRPAANADRTDVTNSVRDVSPPSADGLDGGATS